jgi:hypothetical protein
MGNKKSIGLPGGPNEFLQDITQYISVDGYRRDSVDKTNPVNFIPSGDISMKDVDFPIMGTDNLGNSQMMFPENEYQFPGDMVMEVPQAQLGAMGRVAKPFIKKGVRYLKSFFDDAVSVTDDVVEEVVKKNPIAESVANTPKKLNRPPAEDYVFYRNTSNPESIMKPLDFANPRVYSNWQAPENLSFFTPSNSAFKDYGAQQWGARINPKKPYYEYSPKTYNVDEIKKLMDQGYDAIITTYDKADIRDAYQVVTLDKSIITDLQRYKELGGESLPVAQFGALGRMVKPYAKKGVKYLQDLFQSTPKYNPEEIYRGVYLNDEIRNLQKFVGKTDDEILDIMGTQIPGPTGTYRKSQWNQTMNFGRDFDMAADHVRKFTNPNSFFTLGNTDDFINGQKYVLKVEPNPALRNISAEQNRKLYKEVLNNTGSKDFSYKTFYDAGNARGFGPDLPIRTEGINVIDGNFPQFIGQEGDVMGKLIKAIPIKQQAGEIRQYNPPGFFENLADMLASPMTSFGYSARNQNIPEGLNVNNPDRNAFDSVIDMINPFAWKQYAENASDNVEKGEYLDATFDALGAIPIVPAWMSKGKNFKGPVKETIKKIKEVIKPTDDMVEVFTSDGSKKLMKKTDAVRLNRIEDANVNNKTFTNYEDGNWFSDEVNPFYLNNAKNSLKGGILNPNDPKRVMSAYLDPKDAKLFNVSSEGTSVARNMSGGVGNPALQSEYVLPPALVQIMREGTSGPGFNTMIGNSETIMKNLDAFYKKLGGGVYQEGGGWRDIDVNIEGVKKAIAQAESLGGKLMKNTESTASGLYGQRFSELDKYDLYDGTRDEFIADKDAQERIFNMRLNKGLVSKKGDTITTPLLKDAYDLTIEYKDQLGDDWDYSYEDIINLSNFIGRGGTRKYFGDVIRDGKKLEDVYPTLFGPNAKQKNKTPEEYLKISREFYKAGGSVSWNWKGKSYSGTLIPSMETDKSRFARTKNGKIKTLPKGQYGNREVFEAKVDNTRVATPKFNVLPDLGYTKNPIVEPQINNPFGSYAGFDPSEFEVVQDKTYVDTPTFDIYNKEYLKKLQSENPTLSIEEIEQILYESRGEQNQELLEEYQDPVLIADFIKKSNYYAEGWQDMEGASEEEIKDLQKILLSKGYDIGITGVDGEYGSRTYGAHRAMVDDSNLDPTSITRYYKNYSKDTYDEVKGIQKLLVTKGYMDPMLTNKKGSSIDGKFGDQTKNALDAFNTDNFEEDPKATVFNNIPSALDEPRCAAGMCNILEGNGVLTEAIGVKYKDAWDLFESMEGADNSTSIYNIYDSNLFDNVDEDTPIELLKSITDKVKKKSQTKASDYKIGDIVGLYWQGSSHHEETLGSKTHNTHSGFVSNIVDGVPIITHNVNGRVIQQPYNELSTAWIRRPNEDVEVRSKYEVTDDINNISTDQLAIMNLETKYNSRLSDERKDVVANILKRATYNSSKIPEILNSSVDQDWLKAATFGITGVESGVGFNAPRTIEEARSVNAGLQGIAYDIAGKEDSGISLGIGKTKFASLDKFARQYFDINSPEDLADDNKAVDAVSYILTKNYELFKDYAKQYPSLGLTEQDIRNMAILSYNQGSNRLIGTGRVDDDRTPEEEIAALRALYEGTSPDITSTKYRFGNKLVPGLGDRLYNTALAVGIEQPGEQYISKVNRYIQDIFPQDIAMSEVNPFEVTTMAQGGEYGVFKNYIKGDYDGTKREVYAKGLYDKLNRKHYRQAKLAGMSPANYIMTNLVGNS